MLPIISAKKFLGNFPFDCETETPEFCQGFERQTDVFAKPTLLGNFLTWQNSFTRRKISIARRQDIINSLRQQIFNKFIVKNCFVLSFFTIVGTSWCKKMDATTIV